MKEEQRAATPAPAGAGRFCLSVDVEDWYMGIEIPRERWGGYQPRLGKGLARLRAILRAAGAKATFFVLGEVARRHPEEIAALAAEGHEIASHGLSHAKVYDLSPREFERELSETERLLEAACGARPLGFRAPFFSITNHSLWALEVLKERGYRYDASIYPGSNWRYGIAGAAETLHRLENGLYEFPVSTFKLAGKALGLGGAYLRIFPLGLTLRGLTDRLGQGQAATIYVHPWELDPGHPLVRFRAKAMATHYFNLRSTEKKIGRLVEKLGSVSMASLVEKLG